jgi:hypothetical protein
VTKLNYVFMVLKEHPYGREMLRQLLAAGFEPKAMVEEDSSVGDEEGEVSHEDQGVPSGTDFHGAA